jgi:rhomboid protease GluP
MPSQKREFSYPGHTRDQLLQIAYGAFLELGWTPKYAGPIAIIGYTPRSWKKYDDEILIEASDGTITVTSSFVHNESFDMLGKNKKHINDFITTFEKVRASGIQPSWPEQIEALRKQTMETATEQTKQAGEVDKVMNFSSSNLYATYAIIAINAIVFILMAINGAGFFESNSLVHIKWGSNYTPLTLSGDWWRLITCVFIHFGIIHIAMNTYALYMAGVYLEPMLGKTKYVLAYLCTGVFASIASLWWHKEGVNSAGASGAIFGLYGVFLALLFTNLIPKQIRTSLLSSIGVFVVYNLIYGMKSGVDNAAHIGGLLSGIVIGFIFYPLLKTTDNKDKTNIVLAGIAAATILVAWSYLNSPGNKLDAGARQKALSELKDLGFGDAEKYSSKMKTFQELETEALAPFNETPTLSDTILLQRLNPASVEKWNRALGILEETKNYDISAKDKKQTDLLIEYVNARLEQIKIIEQAVNEGKVENNTQFEKINKKIEALIKQLNDLN